MSKIRLPHLISLMDIAHSEFLHIPNRGQLPGMKRQMTMEEIRALAYFKAALVVLHRMGAIKPEFLEEEPVGINHPDSDSIFEE